MYLDAAAFCGHWPYRHLRDGELPQVLERLKAAGIEGGLMSSLDAIFYNDPWEADGPLVKALAGTAWGVAMSVDPTQPWAEALLRQGKDAGVAAVRLYPCVHGYEEDDERVVALCRFAGALGLPVILTLRMEDERMAYLLTQKEPDFVKIRHLAENCANTTFILSNCLIHQVEQMPANVWFDTAGFKGEFFLENQQCIPADRILFGSFAPLQCIASATLSVPEALKQSVMKDNICQILK